MAVVSLEEALRLMGADDFRKGVPRTDLPGDFGGDETAWLQGWDEAQRAAEDQKAKPQP